MSDPLDQYLDDFPYYPGSKTPRRKPTQVAVKDEPTWDAHPVQKRLPNGTVVDMFTAGALALALGRPLVTLRMWERRGYIPSAPYRLRQSIVAGQPKPGRRLYTRSIIEFTIECFRRHGLADARRIDWTAHKDLSIELFEGWSRIHDNENAMEG